MNNSVSAQGGYGDPLSAAVTERNRDTMQMVRDAIRNKQVLLAYQPVVQTRRQNKAAFHEGLLRVLDKTGRIIPAREFITVAETSEVGRELDCLSIELGVKTLLENPDIRLSINMSARSIGYPKWKENLMRGLAIDKTIAERLILEITESSTMLMPDLVSVFMTEMQAKGISFALDDFGSGYIAFRYFKDFTFDIVKIDGSFIQGITRNPDNQVLTQALVSIAQQFDMYTVAEFVESKEDADYLASIGIDCLQGYYFGAARIDPEWKTDTGQKIAS